MEKEIKVEIMEENDKQKSNIEKKELKGKQISLIFKIAGCVYVIIIGIFGTFLHQISYEFAIANGIIAILIANIFPSPIDLSKIINNITKKNFIQKKEEDIDI